jgi:hypothetical protein
MVPMLLVGSVLAICTVLFATLWRVLLYFRDPKGKVLFIHSQRNPSSYDMLRYTEIPKP